MNVCNNVVVVFECVMYHMKSTNLQQHCQPYVELLSPPETWSTGKSLQCVTWIAILRIRTGHYWPSPTFSGRTCKGPVLCENGLGEPTDIAGVENLVAGLQGHQPKRS